MIIPYTQLRFFNGPKWYEETANRHTVTIGTHFRDNAPTWYFRLNNNWDITKGSCYIIDQGHMAYDRGTDSYLAFSSPQEFQIMHFAESQWWRYRLIAFEKQKIVFIVVSRNACCCLLATASKQKDAAQTREYYPEPAVAWALVHTSVASDNNIEAYPGYTVAFVYSDPFFRWCNTCNYYAGANFTRGLSRYLPQGFDIYAFREDKTAPMYSFLARCEIESNYLWKGKDQHMMSQLETVGLFPNNIDIVVPIEMLSDFIRKEIGTEPVKANVEKEWWFDPMIDVPNDIKTRVINLYHADYDIPELFTGKFYKG